MGERACRRLDLRADAVAHRAALHEDDRMVAVLPRDGGRQPQHVLRPRPPRDLLEAVRGQVVALVDDEVAVVGHAVVHDALAHQALNERHVELPVGLRFPPPIRPIRLRGSTEKRRQALHPLIEQLLSMHEHQRVDAALGDQPRGDDRLAEGGRGGQHTGVVRQQRVRGGLLFRPQFAVEDDIERLARHIVRRESRRSILEVVEQVAQVLQTAARQAEVMRMVLGTGDDARLVVGRQPHRLGLVELRILKGGKPEQPVAQRRRK